MEERVGLAQLADVQRRPLTAVEPGEVDDLDARVHGLPGLEQCGEARHAIVGYARDPDVEAPPTRRLGDARLRAGEEIEQRGLAASGKSDDAESHNDRVYTALGSWRPRPTPL